MTDTPEVGASSAVEKPDPAHCVNCGPKKGKLALTRDDERQKSFVCENCGMEHVVGKRGSVTFPARRGR